MRYCIAIVSFMTTILCFGQKVQINEDIEIEKLSDKVYVYTAWADMGKWGRVGSNGMVVIDHGKALLCDTPADVKQTEELSRYIVHSLKAKIIDFIPNHWHGDCVVGMDYLNKQGVESHANRMTNEILKSKSLPLAKHTFSDSLLLKFGNTPVECYYLGGGHSLDNIVVWLPGENILFGGCMVKDEASKDLGNTVDAAPLSEWLSTIKTVQKKFPGARIVIPGHGNYGDLNLLDHTKKMLEKQLPQVQKK